LGEYAAHDTGRVNTLHSALAEAAYLTALERNGDVVRLASYAPLLAKQNRTQWRPDMIYFSNTNLLLSANYYAQQMFGQNLGDRYLSASVAPAVTNVAVSCVRDSKSGDFILKLVNTGSTAQALQVKLTGAERIADKAQRTVLGADSAAASNSFANPRAVMPQTSEISVGAVFECGVPANSLTVIRLLKR
jgi:alpha-L-arabinofuranosidase